MNTEPATETQLLRLQKFGYKLQNPLTREEAAHLLHEHELKASHAGGGASKAALLHAEVALLRKSLLSAATQQRIELLNQLQKANQSRTHFWMDTCRDPTAMRDSSPETIDLYMRHGCRFNEPTQEQTQEVLDALDKAAASWDSEHPELFYQTLELNFKELLRG